MHHSKLIFPLLLTLLLLSACQSHQEQPPAPIDEVSAHIWIGDDTSQLQLEDDGTFTWYAYPDAPNDNYFTGTYTVYNGDDAISAIAAADYGIGAGEQRTMISRVEEYTLETYYYIVLHKETHITGGVNTLPAEGEDVHYYGFYYPDTGYLDLGNLDDAQYEGFTRTP